MATLPEAGSIWSFRTRPFDEFSPPETGRFAALKVVGVAPDVLVVVVLDGVWTAPPSLEDTRGCGVLRNHRFAAAGRTAMLGFDPDWWSETDLDEMTLLGVLPLTEEEARIAARYRDRVPPLPYGTLSGLNYDAEGEWRWAHDRDAVVSEVALSTAKRDAAFAAERKRYRARLRGLTWEILLSESPFERWDRSPPFPPPAFRDAARAQIHETCRALQALGPKPRRADVRRLLKGCVEWFNLADAEAGEVIETEEREDICEALYEMAHVARQRPLIQEIMAWRVW